MGHIRYLLQGFHQRHGHTRRIHTVLANPKYEARMECQDHAEKDHAEIVMQFKSVKMMVKSVQQSIRKGLFPGPDRGFLCLRILFLFLLQSL